MPRGESPSAFSAISEPMEPSAVEVAVTGGAWRWTFSHQTGVLGVLKDVENM